MLCLNNKLILFLMLISGLAMVSIGCKRPTELGFTQEEQEDSGTITDTGTGTGSSSNDAGPDSGGPDLYEFTTPREL